METTQYEEMEIDLRRLWGMVRRRLHWIILAAVFCAAAAGVYTLYFVEPVYESSTTLIAHKPLMDEELQYNDVMLSQKMVATYQEIVTSRVVLGAVAQRLDLPYGVETLQQKVSAVSVRDTEIIRVVVRDIDPQSAARIADEVASVFIGEVMRIMNVDDVQIIDEAVVPNRASSPNMGLNVAIAALLGLMVALGMVFLAEQLDRTIKTVADAERVLDLPILGVVPNIGEEEITQGGR